MENYMHVCKYLAKYVPERKMCQTKVVERNRIHIFYSEHFFVSRFVFEIVRNKRELSWQLMGCACAGRGSLVVLCDITSLHVLLTVREEVYMVQERSSFHACFCAFCRPEREAVATIAYVRYFKNRDTNVVGTSLPRLCHESFNFLLKKQKGREMPLFKQNTLRIGVFLLCRRRKANIEI